VWFDAPIGYISSTKEWALRRKRLGTVLERSETKLVHFIGKDNIVFHCVIFPAMLKAEGSYILPDNVPMSFELRRKLSTSKKLGGLQRILGRIPESARCFALCFDIKCTETRIMILPGKIFRREIIMNCCDLWNFINRVVVLTNKYYNGNSTKRIFSCR
jgi:methionyl-tRNA synthetase